jgi:hypothetical protein
VYLINDLCHGLDSHARLGVHVTTNLLESTKTQERLGDLGSGA